jgi:hypothetical protein
LKDGRAKWSWNKDSVNLEEFATKYFEQNLGATGAPSAGKPSLAPWGAGATAGGKKVLDQTVVCTDGKSHYPMGSDDQTLPWFYGLWCYLESGIATSAERGPIVAKLVETAEEVLRLGWSMPAEPPFGTRGSFGELLFYQAPRLLFVAKLMHELTRDDKWESLYQAALHQRGGKENLTRLELCRRGMVYDHGARHSWTTSNCVAAMRALWEMEKDEPLRTAFAEGLEASARVAMESLPDASKFDNASQLRFDPDWRKLNAFWVPQRSAREAEAVALRQAKELGRLSPRRSQELRFVREPAFASWIATLAPDTRALKARADAVGRVLASYRYEGLYCSQFFPVEAAWWRMRLADVR